MVDGAAAAVSPDEWNASLARGAQVHLLPRVLVPADDDARCVTVEEQQRLLWGRMPEEPSVRGRDELGLRKVARCAGSIVAHQSSNVRLK